MLSSTPIESITEEVLLRLVDQRVHEGKLIEFKKELWRLDSPDEADKTRQRIEFLKDVSSFANLEGGDLIVGMRQRDGIADELVGVDCQSIDDCRNKLDQLLSRWIQPRLGTQLKFIELAASKYALVIRVLPSIIGPHRVTYTDHGQFYSRNSTGAYQMDTEELRAAFLRSDNYSKRVSDFRRERISLIEKRESPIPLDVDPAMIVHLVPETSITTGLQFSIDELRQCERKLQPIGARLGFHSRPSFEGLLSYVSNKAGKSGCSQYAYLFRNGIVEAFNADISYLNSTQTRLWSRNVEGELINGLKRFFECYNLLGISPPVWLMASLIGARHISMPVDEFQTAHAADRDTLLFPEFRIDDLDAEPWSLIKPTADLIWNAFGLQKCYRIDDNGNVVSLNIDRWTQ